MGKRLRTRVGALLAVFCLVGLSLSSATAQTAAPQAPTAGLHPQFPLLDTEGANVLDSGAPVSTLQTCGACHDTTFIQSHSYHAALGLDAFTAPGQTAGGQAWDASPGAFGRWDPLRYRYLTPAGDERLDLGTPDWLKLFGDRHVGGGPALYARDGSLLTALPADSRNPETAVLDPGAAQPVAWDWAASGGVEMNCFLCHIATPNNTARIAMLQSGAFRWANTATLEGTGLVARAQNEPAYRWNAAAFDASGQLKPDFVLVQDPTNANCGQCHGLVHTDAQAPLALSAAAEFPWGTWVTGQIISGQRIVDSGMNLSGKEALTQPWDVHAARQVQCIDCHFALNNPVYFQARADARPDHLAFDPRRLDLGEYLQRPLHDFAKGAVTQSSIAPELSDTMRRCDGCHNAAATHQWLPYTARHLDTLACESCHIPQLHAPTLQSVDWTALTAAGEPRREYRGVTGDPLAPGSLVTGFQPVLLVRQDVDGQSRLAPHNIVTFWYWVYGDPARPVRLADLQAAWFEGGGYAAEVLAALDADRDGALAEAELVLDTAEKQALIASRLAALGLETPRIAGEAQPYTISHNVANNEWVTRECSDCHTSASRLAEPFLLSASGPAGARPALLAAGNVALGGDMRITGDGAVQYQAAPGRQGLYIFGHSSVPWVDRLGLLAFVGALLGVTVHGGLRFFSSLRLPRHTTQLRRVYVYTVYERFWHWLQTFTIVGLIFTGLIIHKPAIFGIFAFKSVVVAHNVLAVIVIINALLSLFYHLASGEIKQFLPRPQGFFDRIIVQAKYYLYGIFKNEPHPFEKTPRRKLNPLQQVTYFGLLNVLLPAQVLTGALIWSVQQWPELAQRLGGLPLLAPAHSLVAWLLATFVLAHVYLATTGHTPLALVNAMMLGWEEVAVHDPSAHPALDGGGALKPAQEAAHGR